MATPAGPGPALCGDATPPRVQRLDLVLRPDHRGVGASVATPGAGAPQPAGQPGAAPAPRRGGAARGRARARPGPGLDAGLAAAGGGAPLPAECGQYPAAAARRRLRSGRDPRCRRPGCADPAAAPPPRTTRASAAPHGLLPVIGHGAGHRPALLLRRTPRGLTRPPRPESEANGPHAL